MRKKNDTLWDIASDRSVNTVFDEMVQELFRDPHRRGLHENAARKIGKRVRGKPKSRVPVNPRRPPC